MGLIPLPAWVTQLEQTVNDQQEQIGSLQQQLAIATALFREVDEDRLAQRRRIGFLDAHIFDLQQQLEGCEREGQRIVRVRKEIEVALHRSTSWNIELRGAIQSVIDQACCGECNPYVNVLLRAVRSEPSDPSE